MKFSSILALVGLTQAAHQFSSNGVQYSIDLTRDGADIPIKMGLSRGVNSSRPSAASVSSKRATVQSTSNWCGMSDTNPPSGTWQSVFGGWVVPKISLRSGQTADDEPSICQWINSNGTQENYAWWEFVPDALQSVSMTVNTGDIIYTNVTMTSSTSGIIEVINQSAGEEMIVTISGGPGVLCGSSAEWILEDLSSGGGFNPFAQFPDNSFFVPFATTTTGDQVIPVLANEVQIIQGSTLCEASFNNATGNIDVFSTA